jgi:threonine synthase
MADLFDRPERVTRIANDLDALKAHIKGHLST